MLIILLLPAAGAVENREKQEGLTSSPGGISFSATRKISRPPLGKTAIAFGSHEWFARAKSGEMDIPIGAREGDVSVNALTWI